MRARAAFKALIETSTVGVVVLDAASGKLRPHRIASIRSDAAPRPAPGPVCVRGRPAPEAQA